MSAFNTVIVTWKDSKSGQSKDLRIQFKFGDTWQYEYRIGDRIKWGGNDIGSKNAKYVVVDGCLEGTPPEGCGEDFEVYIRNSTIEKVLPASERFDFVKSAKNYVILEE